MRIFLSASLLGVAGLFAACQSSTQAVAAPACETLAACCNGLGPTEQPNCLNVVETGLSTACSTQLVSYAESGLCGSGTGPGSSGGTTAGSSERSNSGSSGGTTAGSSAGSSSSQRSGFSTSTHGGSSGSGSSSAAHDAGADAGQTPECTLPSTFPSGGSCVTVVAANDAGTGVQCNPVTNAPCASGYACDVAAPAGTITGFECYPPPNTALVCGACDDSTTFCAGGETCFSGAECAHYCCTNADCGAGKCTTGGFAPVAPSLGICTAN